MRTANNNDVLLFCTALGVFFILCLEVWNTARRELLFHGKVSKEAEIKAAEEWAVEKLKEGWEEGFQKLRKERNS